MNVPLAFLAAFGWACFLVMVRAALRLSRKLTATEEMLDDVCRDYFTLLGQYALLKGTPAGTRRKHLRLISSHNGKDGDDIGRL